MSSEIFANIPILEPIRVLSVIPGDGKGTSMIFAKRQITALTKLGLINEEFYLKSRTAPEILASEWKRLRKMILKFQPQILHSHFGTATAAFCAITVGLPMVITFRGSDLNPRSDGSWLRSVTGRVLSQLSTLRATQIICVSKQLRDKLWWRKSRANVIPSGVDTSIFYPRAKQEARLELGWNQKERVVLFNDGKRSAVKRLDLALAAIDVAKLLCGEIRFAILDGFLDPNSVPIYMNAADCLLLTSDYEGSPNIVKEAIACNLPVVSVDVGDVSERLDRVYPSRVVSRNTTELGNSLAEILILGKRSNGFKLVEEISLDNTARQILSVYQSAKTG